MVGMLRIIDLVPRGEFPGQKLVGNPPVGVYVTVHHYIRMCINIYVYVRCTFVL